MINKIKIAILSLRRKSHANFRLAYWYLTWPIIKVKVKVMHNLTLKIAQTVTDWASTAIVNTGSRMWPFDWHIYIWPWPILTVKVKVMNISTVNISQTVTDRANITIASNIMSHVTFRLSYLYLTLTHSKGQRCFRNVVSANILTFLFMFVIIHHYFSTSTVEALNFHLREGEYYMSTSCKI